MLWRRALVNSVLFAISDTSPARFLPGIQRSHRSGKARRMPFSLSVMHGRTPQCRPEARTEAHGTVGARRHEHAAGRLFRQDRIAGVALARSETFSQDGLVLRQQCSPLPGKPPREFDSRFHEHRQARRAVDDGPQHVERHFAAADLRWLHEDRMPRRAVHNLAEGGTAFATSAIGLASPAERVRAPGNWSAHG